MKKIIAGVAGIALAISLNGCNSCTKMVKDLESDYLELDRDITVTSAFTGDTLFYYSGPCYFDTEPGGGVTLIFKVNGKSKKADFHGSGYIFKAVEK